MNGQVMNMNPERNFGGMDTHHQDILINTLEDNQMFLKGPWLISIWPGLFQYRHDPKNKKPSYYCLNLGC
jgi:hypothetical protein